MRCREGRLFVPSFLLEPRQRSPGKQTTWKNSGEASPFSFTLKMETSEKRSQSCYMHFFRTRFCKGFAVHLSSFFVFIQCDIHASGRKNNTTIETNLLLEIDGTSDNPLGIEAWDSSYSPKCAWSSQLPSLLLIILIHRKGPKTFLSALCGPL